MPDFWQRLAAAPPDEPLPLATDPDGYTVYLSRAGWEGHILPGHSHIRFIQDLVIAAITNPDELVLEDPAGQVIIYYRRVPQGRHELFPNHWLKIVVKYLYPPERDGRRTGFVSTAYPDRRKGNP